MSKIPKKLRPRWQADDEHTMHARMERHFATKHDELIARLVGRKPAPPSTSTPGGDH